jgi:hypothetical protein
MCVLQQREKSESRTPRVAPTPRTPRQKHLAPSGSQSSIKPPLSPSGSKASLKVRRAGR